MDVVTLFPPEFHMLHFPLWDTDEAVVNYFTDSPREMLWHQHLIHIRQNSMKDLSSYGWGSKSFECKI